MYKIFTSFSSDFNNDVYSTALRVGLRVYSCLCLFLDIWLDIINFFDV